MRGRGERGATLIELIISIVVIAIAASAVLGVLSSTVGRSADAMVMSQAVAIAEAYLEEITLKSFDDPDGVDGEAARPDFDDVNDYHGLVDNGARDQFGTPLAPLAQYTVTVTVAPTAALTGVPGAAVERIDVQVTYSGNGAVALTGYKTQL
jgi:MSHA pilin protein MshD